MESKIMDPDMFMDDLTKTRENINDAVKGDVDDGVKNIMIDMVQKFDELLQADVNDPQTRDAIYKRAIDDVKEILPNFLNFPQIAFVKNEAVSGFLSKHPYAVLSPLNTESLKKISENESTSLPDLYNAIMSIRDAQAHLNPGLSNLLESLGCVIKIMELGTHKVGGFLADLVVTSIILMFCAFAVLLFVGFSKIEFYYPLKAMEWSQGKNYSIGTTYAIGLMVYNLQRFMAMLISAAIGVIGVITVATINSAMQMPGRFRQNDPYRICARGEGFDEDEGLGGGEDGDEEIVGGANTSIVDYFNQHKGTIQEIMEKGAFDPDVKARVNQLFEKHPDADIPDSIRNIIKYASDENFPGVDFKSLPQVTDVLVQFPYSKLSMEQILHRSQTASDPLDFYDALMSLRDLKKEKNPGLANSLEFIGLLTLASQPDSTDKIGGSRTDTRDGIVGFAALFGIIYLVWKNPVISKYYGQKFLSVCFYVLATVFTIGVVLEIITKIIEIRNKDARGNSGHVGRVPLGGGYTFLNCIPICSALITLAIFLFILLVWQLYSYEKRGNPKISMNPGYPGYHSRGCSL